MASEQTKTPTPVTFEKGKTIFRENWKKPLATKYSMAILVSLTVFLIFLGFLFVVCKKSEIYLDVPYVSDIVSPVKLDLESPADGAVVLGEQVEVKGVTVPNSTVIFYTETDENSVESDESGIFAGTINLESGINLLTVTVFTEEGQERSLAMDVILDDQVLGKKIPPGQAKKEEKMAIMGSIDDVATDSITIKDKKGQGKTKTKIDTETKIVGQDRKLLKLEALDADDQAAIVATESATATESGKKALKIFVKQKTLMIKKRRAVQGIITAVDGNQITLSHQIHRDRAYTLFTDEATVVKVKGIEDADLSSLAPGLRIAAVGDLDENGNLVAKRIHVIPGKATGIFKNIPFSEEATGSATPSAAPTATVPMTPPITIMPTISIIPLSPPATTSPTPSF